MAEVLPSEERADEPSDFGSLRPGTRLGRYELLVPIARGGMARVWAARQHGQRGFQKLVAIKTILPHLAEDPEFERMFLDEARIASGVHHPNVCEIYELGEESHTLYLAMEWASGDAMSRVLRPAGKTEALDPRIAARIVADACAGAHSAHELADEDGRHLGVVHRDLSPHNILLTIDGVAKVCDFGVAKALDQLHEQTSAGQIKGKVSYMAPEQITGGGVDRRSDVFSLGCVLYEATTGVRPFRGEGDMQVMQAILQSEVAPPTSVVRHYPIELERIVLRAMAHEPALRYPTAERMRYALEEFLARGPLVTHSDVAHTVRARIGEQIDRRKERIKQASSVAEQVSWDPTSVAPTREPLDQRSRVQPHRAPVTLQSATASARTPGGGAEAGFSDPRSMPPTSRPSATMAMSRPAGPGGTMPPPALGARRSDGFSTGGQPNRDWSTPGHVPLPIGAPDSVSSQPGPYPPSDAAPVLQPDPPSAGAGQYAAAALIGLLCAMLIGGGGFFFWRSRASVPTASPATSITPTATPNARAPSTPIASTAPPSAAAELAIHVTPADATLLLDGKALPPGTRTLPRPPAGKTISVSARAKGHDDSTVFVDYFSANPVEITLKPILEIDNVPPTAPATAKTAPKAHAPAALPDNPY